jgi:hypothetical protein
MATQRRGAGREAGIIMTMEQEKANSAERGYQTADELMRDQGVGPIDLRHLTGDFHPSDAEIDEFLEMLREWRGHGKSDRAA